MLWATGATLGPSLMLMGALRVTHPPAGAIPLIAFAEPVGALLLVEALAVGSVPLVALAMIYHRLGRAFRLGRCATRLWWNRATSDRVR